MSDLFHFLIDLAIDPKGQEIFESNPKAMMDATGLSEADKLGLNSGDRATVAAIFVKELETKEFAAIKGSCYATDPGPDPFPDPDSPPEP